MVLVVAHQTYIRRHISYILSKSCIYTILPVFNLHRYARVCGRNFESSDEPGIITLYYLFRKDIMFKLRPDGGLLTVRL